MFLCVLVWFMPRSHLLVSGHLLVITHLYLSPHQSQYLKEWLSFSFHWIVELFTLNVTLTFLLVDLLCNLFGTLTLILYADTCGEIPPWEWWANWAREFLWRDLMRRITSTSEGGIITTVDCMLDFSCANYLIYYYWRESIPESYFCRSASWQIKPRWLLAMYRH